MPYQVLARKYRPLRFSDVVGQDHVTRTLLNALAQNRIAHGYIFSGHRGIGKTTIARILASALNCRNVIGSPQRPTPEPCNACDSCLEIRTDSSVDVIEIDAATNRGIDEIRELRDAARYRPARDRYKIYILDEAHQITDAAFNALLKTLEEPPEHIVFMMATTQPEDIPQTIRSRCQHYSFHAVKLEDIVGQLRSIATAENISADDAALALLAEAGDGSMRDALSIMDQAIASAPIENNQPILSADQIRELMGTVSNAVFEQILAAVHANNSADVLAILGRLLDAGNGPQPLARQFVRYLRNCTVARITKLTHLPPGTPATGIAADLLQISPEERARAARSAALFTEEELSRFLSILLRTFDDLGYKQEPRFRFELGVLKLVHLQRLLPVEDLLSQLGAPQSTPTPSTTPTSRSTTPPGGPSFAASSQGMGSTEARTPSNAPPLPTALSPAKASPAIVSTSANSTAGALALAPEPSTEPARPHLVAKPTDPAPALDLAALQSNIVAALAAVKGQQSASDALHDATFILAADTLQIQTTLSKAILPIAINPEAERILKSTLRDAAPSLKLTLLPGAPAAANAKRPNRPAANGSATALAENHPLVQQAKRLFSAEISSVIDLRDKE